MANKAFFITFEGGEGVSKSTQAKLLQQYLQAINIQVSLTREPGGTNFGENFRGIILQQEVDPVTELLAMMAARNQHIVELIRPSLLRGCSVICDRFVDSTACYQSVSGHISIDLVYELHRNLLDNFLPHLTILLNLDPKIALSRVMLRNGRSLDKNEQKNLDYHYQIYQRYNLLAKMFPSRIKIIDANGSVEQIHTNIVKLIRDLSLV